MELTGQLPLARVGELLREADVYVSAATSDGTSSSLLEAMASGAFPVVTSIRANRDWLEDGSTGLFFEPREPARSQPRSSARWTTPGCGLRPSRRTAPASRETGTTP